VGAPFVIGSFFIRGQIAKRLIPGLREQAGVAGVYDDPLLTVVGSMGLSGSQEADVTQALSVDDLASNGMDGSGVLIGIVDTGFGGPALDAKATCVDSTNPAGARVLCF